MTFTLDGTWSFVVAVAFILLPVIVMVVRRPRHWPWVLVLMVVATFVWSYAWGLALAVALFSPREGHEMTKKALIASVVFVVLITAVPAFAAPGYHEGTQKEDAYNVYSQHWYTTIQRVNFVTLAPRDCPQATALDPCFDKRSIHWSKDYDPGVLNLDHWAPDENNSGTVLTADGEFIKWKSKLIKGYFRGCFAYQGSPICQNSMAKSKIVIYANGVIKKDSTHTALRTYVEH